MAIEFVMRYNRFHLGKNSPKTTNRLLLLFWRLQQTAITRKRVDAFKGNIAFIFGFVNSFLCAGIGAFVFFEGNKGNYGPTGQNDLVVISSAFVVPSPSNSQILNHSLDKLDYLPIFAKKEGSPVGQEDHTKLSKIFLPEEKKIWVPEKNTLVDAEKTLKNRTRSKALDFVIKGRLMNDPEIRASSPLHEKYVQSTACNGFLAQEEGKIKAFYCKRPWCCVCNRIRTGILFNKYGELLSEWDEKFFVTLTLPNVVAEELSATIDEMLRLFGRCSESIKQTKKLAFQAIRKLEVTYNAPMNTFHPHFHAVVQGEEQAFLLKNYWLQKINHCRVDKAVEEAQKVKPCDDDTALEMFKYFTKLIADNKIYPRALDIIFTSMRGRRTFQAYLPKDVQKRIKKQLDEEELTIDRSTPAIIRVNEKIFWDWIPTARNFVDKETGELLTDYRPSKAFERLLENLSGKDLIEMNVQIAMEEAIKNEPDVLGRIVSEEILGKEMPFANSGCAGFCIDGKSVPVVVGEEGLPPGLGI